MKELKYLHSVSTLKLNTSKCTGCGMCIQVCPHAVFQITNRKAEIADLDACMECGACARNCPAAAIDLKPGVGCAAAIISGWLRRTEPTCGCSGSGSNCC
ncbi:4Fe-4S binding protein [bacterium]|nr:4Fe-4S binding protein [bacterium]